MGKIKKFSIWAVAGLLVSAFAVWCLHARLYMGHVYTLIPCIKGDAPLIPGYLCRAYLFNMGISKEDVAMINFDGSLCTLIEEASKEDAPKLLEFLVKNGVDVKGPGEGIGITPLHAAVLANNADVAELFLRHGADPTIKDLKHGLTPLEYALRLKEKPSSTEDRSAIIKLLENATRS